MLQMPRYHLSILYCQKLLGSGGWIQICPSRANLNYVTPALNVFIYNRVNPQSQIYDYDLGLTWKSSTASFFSNGIINLKASMINQPIFQIYSSLSYIKMYLRPPTILYGIFVHISLVHYESIYCRKETEKKITLFILLPIICHLNKDFLGDRPYLAVE